MDVALSFGAADSPFTFFISAIIAIVLVASWVILAASRFVQGGVVERPERVPQLYGYTVCLVALIVGFASLISIVESSLALADPVHPTGSEWTSWGEPSVTSFEAFRVTYDRGREMRAGPNAPPPEIVAEDELRRRYEALRADRIARTRTTAWRSLITNALVFLIATGLFVGHWRWLRRRGGRPDLSAAMA